MEKITEVEFREQATNIIFNGLMINLNQSFNVSKTNRLAVNLLLKAKLEVQVIQSSDYVNIKNKSIKDLIISTTIEVNPEDPSTFTLTFFTSGDLTKLLASIKANEMLFILYYLTTIYRIIDGSYTNEYILREMERIGAKVNIRSIIEINAMKEAMNKAFMQITVSDLPSKAISKIEKLKELFDLTLLSTDDIPMIEATTLSKKYKNLKFNSERYILPTRVADFEIVETGYQKGMEGVYDITISNVRDALINDISTGTKDNAVGALFAAEFKATKVNTKWFKQIKKSFNNYVQQQTSKFNCSWATQNTTYRKIFKAPKKKYLSEKINVILSIDQSGSISTLSLSQILYIVKKKKQSIGHLTVLLHAAAVTTTFEFTNLEDVSEQNILAAVGTRRSNGGTSHIDVFKHIHEISKKKNLSDFVYLCFTDGYSDIQDGWTKYPIMTKIKTFILNEHNGIGEKVAKQINATCVNLPA